MVPTALAGAQGCSVSWQLLLSEFQWVQHKPQHYLLEGFQLQNLWISSTSREGFAGMSFQQCP